MQQIMNGISSHLKAGQTTLQTEKKYIKERLVFVDWAVQ